MTWREIHAACLEHDVWITKVAMPYEMTTDTSARRLLALSAQGELLVKSPAHQWGATNGAMSSAPAHGEHTIEVLRDWVWDTKGANVGPHSRM